MLMEVLVESVQAGFPLLADVGVLTLENVILIFNLVAEGAVVMVLVFPFP